MALKKSNPGCNCCEPACNCTRYKPWVPRGGSPQTALLSCKCLYNDNEDGQNFPSVTVDVSGVGVWNGNWGPVPATCNPPINCDWNASFGHLACSATTVWQRMIHFCTEGIRDFPGGPIVRYRNFYAMQMVRLGPLLAFNVPFPFTPPLETRYEVTLLSGFAYATAGSFSDILFASRSMWTEIDSAPNNAEPYLYEARKTYRFYSNATHTTFLFREDSCPPVVCQNSAEMQKCNPGPLTVTPGWPRIGDEQPIACDPQNVTVAVSLL